MKYNKIIVPLYCVLSQICYVSMIQSFCSGIIKQLPIHDVWYIIMHFKQLQECLMSQMCDDIIKQ